MSNLKNFYALNFFKDPLLESYNLPELTNLDYDNQRWYLYYFQGDEHKKLLRPEIFEWAEQNNMYVEHCHIFAGPPNHQQDIHTDGPVESNIFGINYVLSGHDSYMAWYKASDNYDLLYTSAGHPFRRWKDNECTEIERDELRLPTLINASVPHKVVNLSNEYRWSLSLRLKPYFKSWSETVDFFKPYII